MSEEQDFNYEEDTSSNAGQLEENDIELEDDSSNDDVSSDDSIEYWKERSLKAEQERDNYKQGLLSVKQKKGLSEKKEEEKIDASERKVLSILEKKNEKEALDMVMDKESNTFIPELSDPSKYNEIIGYLPRNLDKSTPQKIVKALRIASKLWKEEHGILDKKEADKDVSNELSVMSRKPDNSQKEEKKQTRTILRKEKTIDEWY